MMKMSHEPTAPSPTALATAASAALIAKGPRKKLVVAISPTARITAATTKIAHRSMS